MKKIIKKIDLNASNDYQYEQIKKANYYFVPCQITEEPEELEFEYQVEDLKEFTEARSGSNRLKYLLLLQVAQLVDVYGKYKFSLLPENLYFNHQEQVKVLERDVWNLEEGQQGEFLLEYKALIAYFLQKKYICKDYLEGGMDLLAQQESTKFLVDLESVEEVSLEIKKRYEEILNYEKTKLTPVVKSKYRAFKVVFILIVLLALLSGGALFYQKFIILDPQAQALAAERAYLELDYVQVIDSLKEIDIKDLDTHEKYILTVSYIRGQSVDAFDNEAKDLILSRISYNGNQALMDYWIALGRLNTDQAIDIALKQTDDQLLLYAYLQKLNEISNSDSLTGEEKSSAITGLEEKIKKLEDKLNISYQEPTKEIE